MIVSSIVVLRLGFESELKILLKDFEKCALHGWSKYDNASHVCDGILEILATIINAKK